MDDVTISPLARRLAEENSIEWRQIRGSGPDGRVIERDILMYLSRIMSGEAELPSQPDVSEPPPPAGLGEIHGFEDASARLAREGVDLADILGEAPQPARLVAEPAYAAHAVTSAPDGWAAAAEARGEDPASSAVLEVDEPGPAIVPDVGLGVPRDEAREDDDEMAVFELDLDDLLEEPAPVEAVAAWAPREPSSFESHAAPAYADAAAQAFDGATVSGFASHGAPAEAAVAPEPFGSSPLEAPAEPALEAGLTAAAEEIPGLELEAAPAGPELEFEPAVEAPLDAAAQPALAEPDAEPELARADGSAGKGEPAEYVVADAQPEAATAGTPPEVADELDALLAAPPEELPAVSHEPVPAAFGSVNENAPAAPLPAGSMLRRYFDATALLDAQLQLVDALGGTEAPLAVFLARAARLALDELPTVEAVALAMVHDDGLRGLDAPRLFGSFRDAVLDLAGAADAPLVADLAVVDASELEVDELVLPVPGALLSLGRLRDGEELSGTLVLSGRFPPRAGAAFLKRVASLLEAPIRLTV